MPSTLETLYLQSALPISRERILVVQMLAEASDHPTADQLHERARRRIGRITRTTVTRTLRVLAKARLARIFEPLPGVFRYEDATLEAHDHLINLDTGDMVNFSDPELNALISRLARLRGYDLVGHDLTLSGRRLAPGEAGG